MSETTVIVGTVSTLDLAIQAISEHTSDPHTFTEDEHATEQSLLTQFVGLDAPAPAIVKTMETVEGPSKKRGLQCAFLYALSVPTEMVHHPDESRYDQEGTVSMTVTP